ncbi:MAG: glycosyltransferase [Candidatus Limimorpha sp.]
MSDISDNHIHVVCFDVPFPANYGGVIDVFFKIKALSERGMKIHLHVFEYGRPHAAVLENLCFSVNYYKRGTSLKYALSHLPYIVCSRISKELTSNLKKDSYPILLEGLHCCGILLDDDFRDRRVFVRTHNVEHDYYRLLAKSERNILRKLFFILEARKLKCFEPVLNKASGVFAISKNDFEYFDSKFHDVSLIPAFTRFDKVDVLEGQGDYALYHGKLDVAENYNAAEFLVREVFSGTDLRLIIAGMNPPPYLVSLIGKEQNIELIDSPDDETMQNLIHNAHINILVTTQSTGLKLKLLNALYNGRYCVVNSKMVAGLDTDSLCVVADEPSEIRSVVSRLMEQPFSNEQVEMRKRGMERFHNSSDNIDKIVGLLR